MTASKDCNLLEMKLRKKVLFKRHSGWAKVAIKHTRKCRTETIHLCSKKKKYLSVMQ